MAKTVASKIRLTIQRRLVTLMLKYGIYFIFVLLCVGVAIATPTFLTPDNLMNILMQISAIGIVAVGTTFIIILGDIDVSMGSIVALASAIAVIAMKGNNQPWWTGLLLFLGISLIAGVVNGFSAAFIRMPSFLATLGTMMAFRGLVLAISKGQNYWGLPRFYEVVGLGRVGPVPVCVLVMAAAFLVGYLILSKTVFGRQIYAIGGNRDAARVSGVNVEKVRLLAFVLAGFFCSLSSIVLTSRLNSFTPSMASDFPFNVIASVVIGGTSLSGGEGNVGGTLMGVLIIGVVNNTLNLLGVSPYYQDVVRGAIIFLAVMIDALRSRFAQAAD